MPDDEYLRSELNRIAALMRAARTDGSEISRPGRAKFLANFQVEHSCKRCGTITIDQSLPPEQRARAVQSAIKAHMHLLAMESAKARRRERTAKEAAAQAEREAAQAERELADGLAQLDAE